MKIFIIKELEDSQYARDFEINLIKLMRKCDYKNKIKPEKTIRSGATFCTKLKIK